MAERTFDKKEIKELLNSEYLIPAIEWVAEQMPGGFFIYRADRFQEILYVNKAALHIFGCESEEEFREITGNSFFGLVHPADVDTVQKSIDAQIADKDNENLDYVEYRIIRKDGSIRWVDDYGHFAKLPGYGDVYYVFISDVTEKHYVREEINRRANVYQGLLEQFNAFADNSLAVTRANLTTGVIEEVRGKDLYPEDHEGGNVTESMRLRAESFIAEEDRKKFREIFSMENMLERYYKGLGSAVFVGYCRRMSGRHCFVKFSASAVIDPVSEDTIFFSSETEYNTEKVTEVLNKKVLAKQYDMVAYIVGNNYGVVIGDAENIGKGSIFPKEKDGVYTQYLREQVFPVISGTEKEINEISRKLMTETIASELKESDSYYVDVPCEIGGEIFNKRFSYYTIDEESQFYILLKSDMTDVLRKEHEMNELLSTALREMENANAAKTAFLSNMSHEIRTPMNAIVGLDNIALKSSDLSPQTREYLEKIGASAKHLLSIINNILDMSRIESGRVTLKNEKFSFGSMLEQINTMVQSQCMEKGLTYDCHAIGSLGEYYIGDDMKLKQILINMLSNAIKFTDAPGYVTFTIEQTNEFENNATLKFTIKDTGIGMDKEFIPKIFNAFSQENSDSTNKFGSTGLGMAITKNLVEMMNGNITVKSEKGMGTKFTVTVTLRKSNNERLRNTFDTNELNVLIVDDDPVSCQHTQLVLEEVGIYSDMALSGMEALEMIELHNVKQEPYTMILVDWKMPEHNGIEVTRMIRKRYSDSATIIILTAYNWDDILEEALDAGVDSFMAKPLFASNVLNEFENIVKSKHYHEDNEGKTELSGKRILLAEDVEINAEIMKAILQAKSIYVEHVQNGIEALEVFSKSKTGYFDAILMDVRMPVMNGLDATIGIRALKRKDAKNIPIIALTANAFDEDVQNSLQAGMDAHLSKPVEMERLYDTLEKLIGKKRK